MAQFSALYGDLLDIELGSADRSQLFSLVRRKAAINQGQREFARLTKCVRKDGTINLADGVGEYDLEATLTDFLALDPQGPELCITDAAGTKTYLSGEALVQTTVARLNRDEPGWRGADPSDHPAQWYPRQDGGKTYLGFSPAPDIAAGSTYVLTVPYRGLPADMVADADLPFTTAGDSVLTLTDYHQALVHYAASQLEKLRRDYQAIAFQEQRFSAYVDQYKAAHRPIGGSRVWFARDYRRERSHGATNPLLLDPRR